MHSPILTYTYTILENRRNPLINSNIENIKNDLKFFIANSKVT